MGAPEVCETRGGDGHAGLHFSGAGEGETRRRAKRYLRSGNHVLRNAYRQGAVHGTESVRHHERAAAEQPDPAAGSESGNYSRAAGNHLPGTRARSEKALCERAPVHFGSGTSGKGRRGGPRRIAELEAETLAGDAKNSFLHHAGTDPRGCIRPHALLRAPKLVDGAVCLVDYTLTHA